jgi:hypothetical protein
MGILSHAGGQDAVEEVPVEAAGELGWTFTSL